MALFIKTFSQIRDSIDRYILRRNPSLDVKEGTVLDDSMVGPPANEISDLYGQLEQLRKIQSLMHATEVDNDDLDELVYNWGVSRKPGTQAIGTVVFYTTTQPAEDILIPANTAVTTNPDVNGTVRRFLTTTDVTFFGATRAAAFFNFATGFYEIESDVRAEEIGSDGNVASNTVTVNEVGPTQFSVFNPQAFSGGTDPETNADLATRARLAFSGIDINTKAGLENIALQNANVTNAFAVGAGDPLMIRDVNSIGQHVYGRADVYIKNGEIIGRQENFTFQYRRVTDSNAQAAVIFVDGSPNKFYLYLGEANSALGPISEILDIFSVQRVLSDGTYETYDLTHVSVNRTELEDLNRYDSLGRALRYPIGTVIVLDPIANSGKTPPERSFTWKITYSYRASDDYIFQFPPVSEIVSVVGDITGLLVQEGTDLPEGESANYKFVKDTGINVSSVFADDALRWLTFIVTTTDEITRSNENIDSLNHANVDTILEAYMLEPQTDEPVTANGSFTVSLIDPSTGLPGNPFLSASQIIQAVDGLRIVDDEDNVLTEYDVTGAIAESSDAVTTVTIDPIRNPAKIAPQVGQRVRIDYHWKRIFASTNYQVSDDRTGIDWSPSKAVTSLVTITPGTPAWANKTTSEITNVLIATKTDENTLDRTYELTLLSDTREFGKKIENVVGSLGTEIETSSYVSSTPTTPDLVQTAAYQVKIETEKVSGSISQWRDYYVKNGGLAAKINDTLLNENVLVQDVYHIRVTSLADTGSFANVGELWNESASDIVPPEVQPMIVGKRNLESVAVNGYLHLKFGSQDFDNIAINAQSLDDVITQINTVTSSYGDVAFKSTQSGVPSPDGTYLTISSRSSGYVELLTTTNLPNLENELLGYSPYISHVFNGDEFPSDDVVFLTITEPGDVSGYVQQETQAYDSVNQQIVLNNTGVSSIVEIRRSTDSVVISAATYSLTDNVVSFVTDPISPNGLLLVTYTYSSGSFTLRSTSYDFGNGVGVESDEIPNSNSFYSIVDSSVAGVPCLKFKICKTDQQAYATAAGFVSPITSSKFPAGTTSYFNFHGDRTIPTVSGTLAELVSGGNIAWAVTGFATVRPPVAEPISFTAAYEVVSFAHDSITYSNGSPHTVALGPTVTSSVKLYNNALCTGAIIGTEGVDYEVDQDSGTITLLSETGSITPLSGYYATYDYDIKDTIRIEILEPGSYLDSTGSFVLTGNKTDFGNGPNVTSDNFTNSDEFIVFQREGETIRPWGLQGYTLKVLKTDQTQDFLPPGATLVQKFPAGTTAQINIVAQKDSRYVVFSDDDAGTKTVEGEQHDLGVGVGGSFLLNQNASQIISVNTLSGVSYGVEEDVHYTISGYYNISGDWQSRVTMSSGFVVGTQSLWTYEVTTPFANELDLVNIGTVERLADGATPNSDDIPGVRLIVDPIEPADLIDISSVARAEVISSVIAQYSVSETKTEDVQFSLGSGATQDLEQTNIDDVFVRDFQEVTSQDLYLLGTPVFLASNLFADSVKVTDKKHLDAELGPITSIVDLPITFNETVKTLVGGGITGTIVATSGSITFIEGVDFSVNREVGLVAATVTGSIPVSGSVLFDYDYTRYSELVTFSAAQQTQELDHANIIPNTLSVGKYDGVTIYTPNVDYRFDLDSGTITRLATGTIGSEERVQVAYNYYTKIYQEQIEAGVPALSDYVVDTVGGTVDLAVGTSIAVGQVLSVSYEYYTTTYIEGTHYLIDRAADGENANGDPNALITRLNGGTGFIGPVDKVRVTYSYNKSDTRNVGATPQTDLIPGYTFTPLDFVSGLLDDIAYVRTYAFFPRFTIVEGSRLLGVFQTNGEDIHNVMDGVNLVAYFDADMTIGQKANIITSASLGAQPSEDDDYFVRYTFRAPGEGENITVVYRFNKSVLEVQNELNKGKNITADIQCKAASGAPVNIALTAEVSQSANGETTRQSLETLINSFITDLGLAENVEQSDIDQEIRADVSDILKLRLPFDRLTVDAFSVEDEAIAKDVRDFRLTHGIISDSVGENLGSVSDTSIVFNTIASNKFTTQVSSPFDVLNVRTEGLVAGVSVKNGDVTQIRDESVYVLTIEQNGSTNTAFQELHDANGQFGQQIQLANEPTQIVEIKTVGTNHVLTSGVGGYSIVDDLVTLLVNPPLSAGTTLAFTYQYAIATQYSEKFTTDGTDNQVFQFLKFPVTEVLTAVWSGGILVQGSDYSINLVTGVVTLLNPIASGNDVFFTYRYSSTRGQYTIRGNGFDGGTSISGIVSSSGVELPIVYSTPVSNPSFLDQYATAIEIYAVTIDGDPVPEVLRLVDLPGSKGYFTNFNTTGGYASSYAPNVVVNLCFDSTFAGRNYTVYFRKGYITPAGNYPIPNQSLSLSHYYNFYAVTKVMFPATRLILDPSEYVVTNVSSQQENVEFQHAFATTSPNNPLVFWTSSVLMNLNNPTSRFYNSEFYNPIVRGAQIYVRNTLAASAGDTERIHTLRLSTTEEKWYLHYSLGYMVLGGPAPEGSTVSYKWLLNLGAQDITIDANQFATVNKTFVRVLGSNLGDFATPGFAEFST